MFAGSSTSANTIVFPIWVFVHNQDVYKRIKAELRQLIPNSQGVLDRTAANKFPYTNGVIMEEIPSSQPRIAVDDFVTIVRVQNYSIHQNPNMFPNPDAFIPEKRLGEYSLRQRAVFNGFGMGSRACIGSK
ncbi:hypothetical protein AYL99_11331 [Fonsecaea erecta]|uniref:Cytochrome P450 n=1 Tax=Fonsecaea erecta TaxID=1367422 RepID=A0A178Z380_9EURO|nr:hypothetical protein AYL99_11331 [Fonsecaea erecta]OAP54230.1 hypothetical protein AYL99_11331 [Fonsecaea erecta]